MLQLRLYGAEEEQETSKAVSLALQFSGMMSLVYLMANYFMVLVTEVYYF